MSFSKYLQYAAFTKEGEPTVQIIHVGGSTRTKCASEALEYIKEVKPEVGKTFILVLAMTAGEYYGDNRNGDAFAENPIPGVTEQGETLLDCYKSFEDAGIYAHHANKDKEKSMGEVVKSFYNNKMHRVELLLKLDNKKAAKYIRKIEAGEFPALSMGCKIPYDVCSRKGCYNKAKTSADYCKHARALGDIDAKTGEKNFVWNPKPNFFDISFVFRPADRVAFTMKKVADHNLAVPSAYLGLRVENLGNKAAAAKKLSEMNKRLTGEIAAAKLEDGRFIKEILPRSTTKKEPLSGETLDEMARVDLPTAVSTANSLGINPTIVEITRICVRHAGTPDVDNKTSKRIAGMQGGLLGLLNKFPEIISALEEAGIVGLSPSKIDGALQKKLSHYVEKRADLNDYLYRRTVGDVHPEQGKWDLVTIQDAQGNVYNTTRGAVESSQDAATERKAKAALGTGALAGAAYKVLSSGRFGRLLSPLWLGGTALGGKKVYDTLEPETYPATDIPLDTEVQKMSNWNEANIYDSLAQEYLYGNGATLDLRTQDCIKTAAQTFGQHPALTVLSVVDSDDHYVTHNLDTFIKQAEHPAEPRLVNLGALAYWIGDGLLS